MLTIWATGSCEVVLMEAPFSMPDSVTEKVAAVSGASLAPCHLSLPLSLSFFGHKFATRGQHECRAASVVTSGSNHAHTLREAREVSTAKKK